MPGNHVKILIFISICGTAHTAHPQSNRIQQQVDSLKYLGANAFDCNSVFWRIIANKKQAVLFLVDKIDDTRMTAARDKCKTTNLRVGDLAYLALDEIVRLPFFAVTGMQCDVIEGGCQLGVFEYIESNRQKFKLQVLDYYNKENSQLRWVKYGKKELLPCYLKNHIQGRFE